MKILVVRFSSIGDVVLTTPVVRCLKQQTGATIHYITKRAFQTVLINNPYIDELITIDQSIKEVIQRLKEEHYDFVVDLHNNIRTFKLKRSLGVKSAAFPKKNVAKFLLTQFKINHLPPVHVVDRYFEAVKELGVKKDLLPCDYFLGAEDTVDLKALGLTPKKFVAIAMGAQYATKQMPLSLIVQSVQQLTVPVVLLGGKMDQERSRELRQQLFSNQVVDLCGELTLNQSAYMTKEAQVLLTGDTGLMHIASCFQTPIVSVWGNTVPAFGMFAYAPQSKTLASIHEVADLTCRPCSKIGHQSCPKKHFDCMKKQQPDAIYADLLKRVSNPETTV